VDPIVRDRQREEFRDVDRAGSPDQEALEEQADDRAGGVHLKRAFGFQEVPQLRTAFQEYEDGTFMKARKR
jgi:hypothetical protein